MSCGQNLYHLQRLTPLINCCKLDVQPCAAGCRSLSGCWSWPCQAPLVQHHTLAACCRESGRAARPPVALPGHTGAQLDPSSVCTVCRYRPSLRHGLEDQALICSFRFTEENRAIREFVVNAVTTSREVAAWVSRLGLPVNSIQDKLPYHRSASCCPLTWRQQRIGGQATYRAVMVSILQMWACPLL